MRVVKKEEGGKNAKCGRSRKGRKRYQMINMRKGCGR